MTSAAASEGAARLMGTLQRPGPRGSEGVVNLDVTADHIVLRGSRLQPLGFQNRCLLPHSPQESEVNSCVVRSFMFGNPVTPI